MKKWIIITSVFVFFMVAITFIGKADTNGIEECLRDRANAGLKLIASQNSYINVTKTHYVDIDTPILHAVDNGKVQLQSLDGIKQELEQYISVSGCMEGGLVDVSFEPTKTKVEIKNDQESLVIEIPVRFGLIYNVANAIAEVRKNSIYTKYISELKDNPGINVSWTKWDGQDVYVIKDKYSRIEDKEFMYVLLI